MHVSMRVLTWIEVQGCVCMHMRVSVREGSVGVPWPACVMLLHLMWFRWHPVPMLYICCPRLNTPDTCRHAQIQLQMDTHRERERHATQPLSQQKITSRCLRTLRLSAVIADKEKQLMVISFFFYLYLSSFLLGILPVPPLLACCRWWHCFFLDRRVRESSYWEWR